MIILCRKCDAMIRIESNQPTKRNNARLVLTTATGAALGMGARYLVPTKAELSSLKSNSDTFFSSVSTVARGANRSMLKFGAIGAVAAAGIYLVSKLFKKPQEENKFADSFEYSKYQALIDAPEYACEVLIYGD